MNPKARRARFLSIAVCAVCALLFVGLLLVLSLAPTNRALHNAFGWALAFWCAPTIVAGFSLMNSALQTFRRVEPLEGELPFRLRPNRAYRVFVGGLCASFVVVPLLLAPGPKALDADFARVLLALGGLSALIYWLGTGSRATLYDDRLVHSYCGWRRTLALDKIKMIDLFHERNSFILMLNRSPKHRLSLAHFSEASVVRLLQLLRERTPGACWMGLALRWREGEVNG